MNIKRSTIKKTTAAKPEFKESKIKLSDVGKAKLEIKKQIWEFLVTHNISQADLSRKAKIKPAAISGYANAKTLPSKQNFKKLAEVMGMTEKELSFSFVKLDQKKEYDTKPVFGIFESKQKGKRILKLNCTVSKKTALAVIKLIQRDEFLDF